MDIQAQVKSELHKIHRRRTRVGYFPNIVSLLLSLYFQREKLALDSRWWTVLILMIAGTVLRILINEVFFDKWRREVQWARITNWIAFFCLSLAWGLHFSDIYFHYGGDSSNVIYTFLVLVGFLTAASTLTIGDAVSYYIFVIVMSVVVSYTYVTDPYQPHAYVVLNVIIFLAFSIANYRIGHKQLLDLIKAQIKSNAEKENLKNIINTVPGFVGLIDKDLVCYMANQTTLMMYPAIVGSKIGTLDPDASWEKFIVDFMKSDKRTDITEERTKFLGQDVYALLNIQKMDDGGAIIVSIITTELVEAEKKIREQEAKAQYASKLASLGEMAAGIAHEVNNPLTIIQGTANILSKLVESEPIDVATVQSLTTKMIVTSERISKTVKSLKALSRNGENDPKTEVSVDNVINQCLDVSSQKCSNSDIKLDYISNQIDLSVYGREVELSQVLINLLINAMDAVKNLEDKWITIRVEKEDGFVNIFVTDSGKGIPIEIRDKIMNPFFTTKDVNQGTGLGLSISKNIIGSHDGELSLMDKAPHTTFRIRLPLYQGER